MVATVLLFYAWDDLFALRSCFSLLSFIFYVRCGFPIALDLRAIR